MDYVKEYADLDILEPVEINAIQTRALGIAQTNGLRVGGGGAACTDGATLLVDPCTLVFETPVLEVPDPGHTFSTADLETGAAYVPSTWYYAYAFVVGTLVGGVITYAIAYQLSTTPPDNARRFKSGGATHVYLASVYCNAGGTLRRFYQRHGRVTYHDGAEVPGSGAFAASSFASVSLAGGLIPPHARVVRMLCHAEGYTTFGSLSLRTDASGAANARVLCFAQYQASDHVELPVVGTSGFATAFQYAVSGGGFASFWVTGYDD